MNVEGGEYLGIGDHFDLVHLTARDVVKAEQIVDYTADESLSEQLARRFGTTAAESFFNGILSSSAANRAAIR